MKPRLAVERMQTAQLWKRARADVLELRSSLEGLGSRRPNLVVVNELSAILAELYLRGDQMLLPVD